MRDRKRRAMKKRWLSSVLALCMSAGLLIMPVGIVWAQETGATDSPNWAESGVESDFRWREIADNNGYGTGKVEIRGYNGSDTAIEIPSTIGGKPVVKIDSGAFQNKIQLVSVKIPTGVTSIGSSAFNYCNKLTSVEIPTSVTSIGASAFMYCTSLTSVTIPYGVTSIEPSTFDYCSSLASITIPASVTSIGKYAFSGCSSLTGITIPSHVNSIGESVFSGCSSLASITVEDGNAMYISKEGVLYTRDLTHLLVCPQGKEGNVEIFDRTTVIADEAFYCCDKLTGIKIPDSLVSIGKRAFYNCSSMAGITLPATVTSIGASAFYGCDKLTSVTIPSKVTSIEDGTFNYCEGLASVTIPSSVTSIGNRAFSNTALTSVTIPSSVTSIGDSAFYYCSSLASVKISEGVKSIGREAFQSCSNLASVEIPSSVASIEYATFDGCRKLASVEIPSGVKSIGEYAFGACSGMSSIKIPDSVEEIKGYAFARCSKLASVAIPSKVTKIENGTFNYCQNLVSIGIPASVTSIAKETVISYTKYVAAFANCKKLADVYYAASEEDWKKVDGREGVEGEGKTVHYNSTLPVTPVTPETPTKPEDPVTPENSSTPENPSTSTEPSTPEAPSTPAGTTQPTKPFLPGFIQGTVTDDPGKKSAPMTKGEEVSLEDAKETLVSRIETQASPEIVTKEYAPKLDRSVFQKAMEKQKDITMAVTNDAGQLMYSWSFSNKNLDSSKVAGIESMDLSISFNTDKKDEIKSQTGIKGSVYLDISGYKGTLPGPATVKIYVGDKYANGSRVYLYYYNEDQKRAEMPVKGMGNAYRVESGYITCTLTHCSVYFISDEEQIPYGIGGESQPGQTGQARQGSPKTGDSAAAGAWAFAILASAVAVGCLWRKRSYSAR